MDYAKGESIKNCVQKWCRKLCAFLFDVTWAFGKMCIDVFQKFFPTRIESQNKLSVAARVPHVPNDSENALATFLDIAVLRCLFVSHWPEEGVYWALTFFNKRSAINTNSLLWIHFLIDTQKNIWKVTNGLDKLRCGTSRSI